MVTQVLERRRSRYYSPLLAAPGDTLAKRVHIAQALLNKNAKVYIAARSPEKAAQAIQDLKNETGKEALFLKLDLADLSSIKVAAEEYMRYPVLLKPLLALVDVDSPRHSKEGELHILFNNAYVGIRYLRNT